MKGLLVFDERSDIAFYSLDKELEKYIICRIRHLEEAAGAQVRSSSSSGLGRRLQAWCSCADGKKGYSVFNQAFSS